jgi:signal transduction histidine kinase
LIEQKGRQAFAELRDKKGPFVFMNTYVFVTSPGGTELVNGGLPALEGRNLMDLRDLEGRATVKDEIAIAMAEGNAWLKSYWYKPGGDTMAPKQTYVRKVQYGDETFIVGSGYYTREEPVT